MRIHHARHAHARACHGSCVFGDFLRLSVIREVDGKVWLRAGDAVLMLGAASSCRMTASLPKVR
jgi:hypothetical protein